MTQTPDSLNPAPPPGPPGRRAARRPGFRWGRLLIKLTLLLVLVAGGHAVLWHLLLGRMETGLQQWEAARRSQGWQVAHGTPERGGWPFAARLTLPAWRLTLPQGAAWQAEALRLELRPTRLDELLLRPAGAQSLILGGTTLPLTAEHLLAALPLSGGDAPPDRARLEGRGLRLGEPANSVTLERLQGDYATASATESRLTLALDGIVLPVPTPLGPRIEAAGLDLALNGAPPLAGSPAQRAAQWRDGGGAVELRALTLRWAEVAASAAATITLDPQLQPLAAGTLRLTGADRLLEALIQAGMVPQRSAGMARSLLPLMQRPDPAGGPPQLEVPVTLENRTISVARLALGRMPPIAW